MDVDPVRKVTLYRKALDVRLILPETDTVPVLASPVGMGRRTHIQSFQNVCFPLGVVSVDYIDSRGKGEGRICIIPEIMAF